MAATPSNMIPLGTVAPAFTLLDTISGKHVSLTELKSPIATVIMFICNHCPYVKLLQTKIVETAIHYQKQNISFIAISANDAVTYPQDGPNEMKQEAIEHHYPFPYLYDETQQVARAYQAACTPDFYIFDKDMRCAYRGRFDDATPGNGKPVTGSDLTSALQSLLTNSPVNTHQEPSIGCNIKWKK